MIVSGRKRKRKRKRKRQSKRKRKRQSKRKRNSIEGGSDSNDDTCSQDKNKNDSVSDYENKGTEIKCIEKVCNGNRVEHVTLAGQC